MFYSSIDVRCCFRVVTRNFFHVFCFVCMFKFFVTILLFRTQSLISLKCDNLFYKSTNIRSSFLFGRKRKLGILETMVCSVMMATLMSFLRSFFLCCCFCVQNHNFLSSLNDLLGWKWFKYGQQKHPNRICQSDKNVSSIRYTKLENKILLLRRNDPVNPLNPDIFLSLWRVTIYMIQWVEF